MPCSWRDADPGLAHFFGVGAIVMPALETPPTVPKLADLVEAVHVRADQP